ncbi:MAG: hypothetical protein ACYDER_06360 [Ktedonobacteraceae bacterium]
MSFWSGWVAVCIIETGSIAESGSASPAATASSGSMTTGGTLGSTVIAQVNSVQNNSSVNFTLASNAISECNHSSE